MWRYRELCVYQPNKTPRRATSGGDGSRVAEVVLGAGVTIGGTLLTSGGTIIQRSIGIGAGAADSRREPGIDAIRR